MRAVTYARVSTDAQERDGSSLETQERACVELALAAGWHVVESLRDTASGYTLERPGMARVRQLLMRGLVDRVVVYAVDRLSRNQNHIGVLFEEVQQADARLEVVTEKFEDTAIGRFILAARAFTAEVAREKIAERTMRGKRERARSGRIPQAMGRGCYGYVYDPATGRREVDAVQAEIVRRIFVRFTQTRSFSAVSNELNDERIPAHRGGRWYPLTIQNMLQNESYTGRLFYGRTRWVSSRGPNGKRRRRPVDQPREEWIPVEGASPRIIDEALWQRVQDLLQDPERQPKHIALRVYPLRGRLRCGSCGAAMVGQTMTAKGREYRYYGCRHIYNRRTGRDCSSRYVRADELERGLWDEVRRVLTDPALVLRELGRGHAPEPDTAEIELLEKRLASGRGRERRLVQLFSFGEVDEDVVREQMAEIRRERSVLEERLRALRPARAVSPQAIDEPLRARACGAVQRWLDGADDADRQLALEALQITITATPERATVSGVLPADAEEFFISQRALA